jgi:hypothetical protein
MSNGFASGGATAPYPSSGFPSIAFFGQSGSPGRSGILTNAGGGGGSSRAAVNSVLPASVTKNHTIGVLVVVIGGYLLWHMSSRI